MHERRLHCHPPWTRGPTRGSEGHVCLIFVFSSNPSLTVLSLGDYLDNAAQDRDRLTRIFREELRKTADDLLEHRQDIMRLEQNIARTQRTILSLQDHLIRQTQSSVLFNGVTESYQVVTRALRGLNDIIFDVDRQPRYPGDVVITAVEKETLKIHGLGYLSQLLHPPETLTQDIDDLRLRALDILSPQQQHLARVLLEAQESDGQRNFLHLPRPDRSTAMDRVRDFLNEEEQQTLDDFLRTKPKRLLSRREQINITNVDLYLFEEDGKYYNVSAQKQDLDNLRAERADTQACLEALEAE
ncbi:hypothetical protein C8R44DRAFT_846643 [Mycena epipterygia]|nr:hypothetical protein C8R44DRAFT_846643 [Mycena epipterygia]